MTEDEKLRIASVHAAIALGEADIKNGKTIRFTENTLSEISAKARLNFLKKTIDFWNFLLYVHKK